MSTSFAENLPIHEPFRHEAFFYTGESEFIDRTTSFIREGLNAGEPVLVAVVGPKMDVIRSSLGRDAKGVFFADMAQVGRNPARIIPLWREFLDRHAATTQSVRGIGEPIWATRSPEELVESQRHEALLNLAFARDPVWILCPYDLLSLGPSVIEEARKSHPFVSYGGEAEGSTICLDPEAWAAPFDHPLAETPQKTQSIRIVKDGLAEVRALVNREALKSGLSQSRSDDLVIAVHEVATNSIRHGGGSGTLRIWDDGSTLVCEVADEAHISKPLVGRERPKAGQEGGFGLWLVNQLCDLVQIRTFRTGSVVRLHMAHP